MKGQDKNYFKSVLEFQDNFKREGMVNRYILDSKILWRGASQLSNSEAEFEFPPTVYNKLTDLREIRVRYKINIVKDSGTDVAADVGEGDVVGVINHAAANIVDGVTIAWNGTVVEKITKNHLKTFLKDHFAFTPEERERNFSHEVFSEEADGAHNGKTITANAYNNEHFRNRCSFFGTPSGTPFSVKYEKNSIELDVTQDFAISESKLPLVPGMPMTITLTFVKPDFFLEGVTRTSTNYYFQVTSARMGVMQRTYTDEYVKDVEKLLEQGITYRFPYYALKELTMDAGSISLLNKNFLNYYGVNPVRFYVFPVLDSLARPNFNRPQHYFRVYFPGEGEDEDVTGNPTAENARLTSFNITVDGENLLLNTTMNADSVALYLFKVSMEAVKKKFERADGTYPMTLQNWMHNGYACIIVDNTKSQYYNNDGTVRQPSREGHVEMNAGFDRQLGYAVRFQILSEYHCQVVVDKNRKALRKEVVADDA